MFAAIEKNVQIKFILPGQSFRLLRSDLAECAVLSPGIVTSYSDFFFLFLCSFIQKINVMPG